jgi:hypothetical protein
MNPIEWMLFSQMSKGLNRSLLLYKIVSAVANARSRWIGQAAGWAILWGVCTFTKVDPRAFVRLLTEV